MKHKTLANLSHLPLATIELIRRTLRGEVFLSASEDVKITASRSHGAVYAVLGMIRKLGLDQLIYSRNIWWRVLVLAIVVARILEGGSKLFASRWWQGTTLPELLGLPTEGKVVNLLYEAMDKLLCRREPFRRSWPAVISRKDAWCSGTSPPATGAVDELCPS